LPVKFTIKAAHIEAPTQVLGFEYPGGTVNVIDRDVAAFFLHDVPRTPAMLGTRLLRVEQLANKETGEARRWNAQAAAELAGAKAKGGKKLHLL
jgi:hypothetical protein